ncbi:hypothetical protein IQ274_23720 [Nostoc sp. LEGE 12447]|uniref:hypothetical protein n=1 Tax=Nostoc sp. LEGE 12447 TaxID=1828640 RepID=UPI001883900F|nr:hypothetical protein [Nostoc sp. LEGE 12447]MBE9001147.1 hypothetical protein [Nostoc sp. LEGE 12447]
MFDWLQKSFQQNSILWLLVSSIIGGIIGAMTKLIFDVILPQKLQNSLQVKKVVEKYRNPILRASLDLQSRLYNIVDQSFLQIYCHRSDVDKEYAITSTLYVFAEFLAWTEILRREVQFLDFGNAKSNQELERLLGNISRQFTSDALNFTFRLPKGQQRAIGEIMIVEGESLECIGFAKFASKLENEPDFSRWFSSLKEDIRVLASQPKNYGERLQDDQRLVEIYNALVKLLEFLDPNYVYVPKKRMKVLASL